MSSLYTYKRPESVLVVIYSSSYHLLLLERISPKDYWQSVTGSLRWEESPEEAAHREVFEETGIEGGQWHNSNISKTYPIHPDWKDKFHPEALENKEYLFFLRVDRPNIKLNASEHKNYDWTNLDLSMKKISSVTNIEAVSHLKTLIRSDEDHTY